MNQERRRGSLPGGSVVDLQKVVCRPKDFVGFPYSIHKLYRTNKENEAWRVKGVTAKRCCEIADTPTFYIVYKLLL